MPPHRHDARPRQTLCRPPGGGDAGHAARARTRARYLGRGPGGEGFAWVAGAGIDVGIDVGFQHFLSPGAVVEGAGLGHINRHIRPVTKH